MRIEQLNLPSSSSRPTTAAGSATTALARSWAIGQLMSVSVLSRVSPDVLQITVDGQPMLAKTAVDLPAGTQVTARVISAGNQPQLTLLPLAQPAAAAPEALAVTSALGRALPQQQPLADVIPRLIDVITLKASDESVPPAVAKSLASLAQAMPELASLRQPAALATALSHAGLQMEHALAREVARVPGAGTAPNAQAPQAKLPVEDLKWQLMNLREVVLAAVARQHATTSRAHESLPAPQSPSPSTPQFAQDGSQKALGPGNDLPTPAASSSVMDGLLEDVDAGLARITTHQLQSSNAAQANVLLAHFEVPVHSNVGIETLDIEVRDELQNRKADAPKLLTVMLEIPVGTVGKLRARIALAGERIAITTWSETPALCELIARHISQLDQALVNQGFDVSPSVVGKLDAPKSVRSGQGPLIDIEV